MLMDSPLSQNRNSPIKEMVLGLKSCMVFLSMIVITARLWTRSAYCIRLKDSGSGDIQWQTEYNSSYVISIACGYNQFQCKVSFACISRCKVCDGVDNCGDGSDEAMCSKYINNVPCLRRLIWSRFFRFVTCQFIKRRTRQVASRPLNRTTKKCRPTALVKWGWKKNANKNKIYISE